MTSNQSTNTRKTNEMPIAVWWRVISETQQIMQDNTSKVMEQVFENQKKIIRLCLNADSNTDSLK